MKTAIIIVAGGKGTRMGSDVPKQFLLLRERPILMHTIEKFVESLPEAEIVVVLPKAHKSRWETLCKQHSFVCKHTVAEGGQTRFHSVKNGMAVLASDIDFIAVHDAVRPLVAAEVIHTCFQEVQQSHAVIPCIAMDDSLRMLSDTGNSAVDRSNYKRVQTPQVFDAPLLIKAYQQPFSDVFTDDASVVEAIGATITMVAGNPENIKITRPSDLLLADCFMNALQGESPQ